MVTTAHEPGMIKRYLQFSRYARAVLARFAIVRSAPIHCGEVFKGGRIAPYHIVWRWS